MGKSQNIVIKTMRKISSMIRQHTACRGLLLALDEEECVEGACNGNSQITPNEDW